MYKPERQLFYSYYTVAGTPDMKWRILLFYYPHAPADGSQQLQITEKTLKFSSLVLPTLFHTNCTKHPANPALFGNGC